MYIKTRITYGNKINNTGLYNSGVSNDGVDCNCMTIISIGSLFIYKKNHYLQVYVDECVYKTEETDNEVS